MPLSTALDRLPSLIAIDGPAASGKTSVGRALVQHFGYRFLDTGVTYRAVTLAALRTGISPADEAACAALAGRLDIRLEPDGTRTSLGEEDVTELIRGPEVESNVSSYSALPAVREVMVRLQRRFAAEGHAVLAGRDIGTVVLPDAPLKFYLQASEAARAERRSAQATSWGPAQATAEARRDITLRDRKDSSRAVSPLQAAPDAIVIDTTDLALEDLIARVIEAVECAAA